MSLILCPECGARISDKALTCPHCGYSSADKLLPISVQDHYEPAPVFQYDIEEWNPNRGDLTEIAYEDNRSLFEFFGKWENIKNSLPAIAEVFEAMAMKETYLVASYDDYIAKKIKEGVYRFSVDKNGEILPTIRDGKSIVKQVRLREMHFNPQMAQALNNLATHAALAQILDEIEYVGDAIRGIHVELQDDRIAMAESAWDKLVQARTIKDARLREIAILNVISTATDAKRTLMRNFIRNNEEVLKISQMSSLDMLKTRTKVNDSQQHSGDAMQDLISITNAVQVECEGYATIGEYDACKASLTQFRDFVLENKLDQRDTLLALNSGLKLKQNNVVKRFSDVAARISTFDPSLQIEQTFHDLIEGGEVVDET